MKYTKQNNIYIIEVPVSDFKIIMNDSPKKSALPKNYCNAGFFANYDENNQYFTLPVAHLVCDYDATSKYTKKYCTERGKFNGNKFTFDSSTWSYCNAHYKKAISTLLTKNDKAEIKEIASIPTGYNYAISGIPIMKNGSSVNFEKNVQSQGWDSSPLYGTWHIFVGLKKNDNKNIYIIGMETTTWNMVKTNEAYKKLKTLGMYDVIKLDGGGSFYMNVNGKAVASTWEDRRINTVISFNEVNDDNNDDGKYENKDDAENKNAVIDKNDKKEDVVKVANANNVEIQSASQSTSKETATNKNVAKAKNDTKMNANTNINKSKHSSILKSFLKRNKFIKFK